RNAELGGGELAARSGGRALSEALPADPGRGRFDLRHRGGARGVAAPFHLHRDVVLGVPALRLAPARGHPVLEMGGRALAETLGARLLQVETLVHYFVVVCHGPASLAADRQASTDTDSSFM